MAATWLKAAAFAWMFDRKGVICLDRTKVKRRPDYGNCFRSQAPKTLLTMAIAGQCKPLWQDFALVRDALETAGIPMESAELNMVPQTMMEVDAETATKVLRFMDALDDNDDVQNVYVNIDFPDELMEG